MYSSHHGRRGTDAGELALESGTLPPSLSLALFHSLYTPSLSLSLPRSCPRERYTPFLSLSCSPSLSRSLSLALAIGAPSLSAYTLSPSLSRSPLLDLESGVLPLSAVPFHFPDYSRNPFEVRYVVPKHVIHVIRECTQTGVPRS